MTQTSRKRATAFAEKLLDCVGDVPKLVHRRTAVWVVPGPPPIPSRLVPQAERHGLRGPVPALWINACGVSEYAADCQRIRQANWCVYDLPMTKRRLLAGLAKTSRKRVVLRGCNHGVKGFELTCLWEELNSFAPWAARRFAGVTPNEFPVAMRYEEYWKDTHPNQIGYIWSAAAAQLHGMREVRRSGSSLLIPVKVRPPFDSSTK